MRAWLARIYFVARLVADQPLNLPKPHLDVGGFAKPAPQRSDPLPDPILRSTGIAKSAIHAKCEDRFGKLPLVVNDISPRILLMSGQTEAGYHALP